MNILVLFPFGGILFTNLDIITYNLQKEFSTKFQLWHDSLGGDAIGLTWEKSYPSKVYNLCIYCWFSAKYINEFLNPCKWIFWSLFFLSFSKKRKQEEVVKEGYDPRKVLKAVGEVGKGFVRSIYFLKPPRLAN